MSEDNWAITKIFGIFIVVYLVGFRIAYALAERHNRTLPEGTSSTSWHPPEFVGLFWPIYLLVITFNTISKVIAMGPGKPIKAICCWLWYASGKTIDATIYLFTNKLPPKKMEAPVPVIDEVPEKVNEDDPELDALLRAINTTPISEPSRPQQAAQAVPTQARRQPLQGQGSNQLHGTATVGPRRAFFPGTTDPFPSDTLVIEMPDIDLRDRNVTIRDEGGFRITEIRDRNSTEAPLPISMVPISPQPVNRIHEPEIPSSSSPIEVVPEPPTKDEDVFDTL